MAEYSCLVVEDSPMMRVSSLTLALSRIRGLEVCRGGTTGWTG